MSVFVLALVGCAGANNVDGGDGGVALGGSGGGGGGSDGGVSDGGGSDGGNDSATAA